MDERCGESYNRITSYNVCYTKLLRTITEETESVSVCQASAIRAIDPDTTPAQYRNNFVQHTLYEVIRRDDIQDTEEFVEESLSLEDKEIELIKKALERHKGKRKYAAQELGISERTLYRKIT